MCWLDYARPPTKLKVDPYIILQLCTDSHAWKYQFCYVWESDEFQQIIRAWHAVKAKVFIWDYTTDFVHYLVWESRTLPETYYFGWEDLFRGGEMGLGYDADRDLIVILAREIVVEGSDPEEASVVRFWCSRQQASQLAAWSDEVVNRGRPICPLCGQPMDPAGHFCPKKNGHRH